MGSFFLHPPQGVQVVFFTSTLGGMGNPLHLAGVLMVSFGEKNL